MPYLELLHYCIYLQTSTFQLVLSYNGEDTYVLYSYATNGMNFQVGDIFIGYVANGKIVRSPNSENGSWLRRADINLVQGGKLKKIAP